MRKKTCCFTGHRVIPPENLSALSAELEAVLRRLIQSGVRYFGAGGALGFDTLAAETVLRLKGQYSQLQLILVLPCPEQARGWRPEEIRRYKVILEKADKVVYIARHYTRGCMHRRNRHLVDCSSVCVAYCTRDTGGSAYTVNYAKKRGIRVIWLRPP